MPKIMSATSTIRAVSTQLGKADAKSAGVPDGLDVGVAAGTTPAKALDGLPDRAATKTLAMMIPPCSPPAPECHGAGSDKHYPDFAICEAIYHMDRYLRIRRPLAGRDSRRAAGWSRAARMPGGLLASGQGGVSPGNSGARKAA
jgi:hypothetical protein